MCTSTWLDVDAEPSQPETVMLLVTAAPASGICTSASLVCLAQPPPDPLTVRVNVLLCGVCPVPDTVTV